MADLILIVAGLVGTFITKNKRWMILTIIGILLIVYEFISIYLEFYSPF